MFCKYCGSKLIDDAAFCHECGKATYEQSAQPVYQQPVPQAQPAQPVYQQPIPPVQPVQPVYQQPAPPVIQQPVYQPPVYQPPTAPQYTYTIPAQPQQPAAQATFDAAQLAKLEKQTLTLGILGLSLSMLGVPGIILSGIAAKKAGLYKKLTGKVDGKVLTGYRLAKAGRAVSIIMTIVLTIVVLTLQGRVTYEFNNPFEYYDF